MKLGFDSKSVIFLYPKQLVKFIYNGCKQRFVSAGILFPLCAKLVSKMIVVPLLFTKKTDILGVHEILIYL